MKKKYIFIPLILLVAVVILAGYFVSVEFASDAAEKKISQTLKMIQPELENMAISYEEVRSNPFLSNISFKNLNITIKNDEKDNKLSAEKITIDLSSNDYKKIREDDFMENPRLEDFSFIAEKLKVSDSGIKNFLFMEKIALKFDGEINLQQIDKIIDPDNFFNNKLILDLKLKDLKVKADSDFQSQYIEDNEFVQRYLIFFSSIFNDKLNGEAIIFDNFNIFINFDPIENKIELKNILLNANNTKTQGNLLVEFTENMQDIRNLYTVSLDLKSDGKGIKDIKIIDGISYDLAKSKFNLNLFLKLNQSSFPLEDYFYKSNLTIKDFNLKTELEENMIYEIYPFAEKLSNIQIKDFNYVIDANMNEVALKSFNFDSNLFDTQMQAKITPDFQAYKNFIIDSMNFELLFSDKDLEEQLSPLLANPFLEKEDDKYILNIEDFKLFDSPDNDDDFDYWY